MFDMISLESNMVFDVQSRIESLSREAQVGRLTRDITQSARVASR